MDKIAFVLQGMILIARQALLHDVSTQSEEFGVFLLFIEKNHNMNKNDHASEVMGMAELLRSPDIPFDKSNFASVARQILSTENANLVFTSLHYYLDYLNNTTNVNDFQSEVMQFQSSLPRPHIAA